MLRTKRLLPFVGIASLVAAIVGPPTSRAHPPDTEPPPSSAGQPPTDQLRQARQATEVFRDVDAAIAAGYQPSNECEDDPKYGAMGVHYANPQLIADGVLDVARPEILVYEPTRDGGLRLVAIEYFQVDADQDLHTDADRPWLFDVPFDGPMFGHTPDMPIHYDLHVWLYRHNPAGLFAMWNPAVQCP